MEQQDKFGRPIPNDIFRRLAHYGWALENCGYAEHESKPNLFVMKTEVVTFYADMRGTNEVPIWANSVPLLYWNIKARTPKWKQRRLVNQERKRLTDAGCPTRLSWFETDEPDGLMMGEDDGYCSACGKDFGGAGKFCSDRCKKKKSQTERSSKG